MGGAVCLQLSKGNKKLCSFDNCSTSYSPFSSSYVRYHSGGLYFFHLNGGNVYKCPFNNCTSCDAGGLFFSSNISSLVDNSNDSVVGCSFYNCSAINEKSSYAYGIGTIFESHQGTRIVDCLFEECSSTYYGGGLEFDTSRLCENTTKRCYFEDNKATENGFDIFIRNYGGGSVNPISKDTHSSYTGIKNCYYFDGEEFKEVDWLKKGKNEINGSKTVIFSSLTLWGMLVIFIVGGYFFIVLLVDIIVFCAFWRRYKNVRSSQKKVQVKTVYVGGL